MATNSSTLAELFEVKKVYEVPLLFDRPVRPVKRNKNNNYS